MSSGKERATVTRVISRRDLLKGLGAAGVAAALLGERDTKAEAHVLLELDGQVAVVTGGGRGIGRSIAMTLAGAGADVAVIETDLLDTPYNQYRKKDINGMSAAEPVVSQIKALGRRAIAVKADVSKWGEAHAAFNEILGKMGKIDIWVNNAGVNYVPPSFEELPVEAWDQVWDVNVNGILFCCHAVIPHMKGRGYGRIVNIVAVDGKRGVGTSTRAPHYAASKNAAWGLTQGLAAQLAPFNITVNGVAPGIVWTQEQVELCLTAPRRPKDMTVEDFFNKTVQPGIPQRRAQTPEDIARQVLNYCTMPNVTGRCENIDGGMLIGI